MALRMEHLENRVLLSVARNLVIDGTDGDDVISVQGTGDGEVDVFFNRGLLGSFEGVRNIHIKGLGGDDVISAYNVQIGGNLSVTDTPGNNHIEVTGGRGGPGLSSIGRNVDITTGDGRDTIAVGHVEFDCNCGVALDSHDGTGNVIIGRKLMINAGHGDNWVGVGHVEGLGGPVAAVAAETNGESGGSLSVGRHVSIRTGRGNDLVQVVDARSESLNCEPAAEDGAFVVGLDLGGSLSIATDGGYDAILVGSLGLYDDVLAPPAADGLATENLSDRLAPAAGGQFKLAGRLLIDAGRMDDLVVVAAIHRQATAYECDPEAAARDVAAAEVLPANGVNVGGNVDVRLRDGNDIAVIGTGLLDTEVLNPLDAPGTNGVAAERPTKAIGGQMAIAGRVLIDGDNGDDLAVVGAAAIGGVVGPFGAAEVPVGLDIGRWLRVDLGRGDDVLLAGSADVAVGTVATETVAAERGVIADGAYGLFNVTESVRVETSHGNDFVAIVAAEVQVAVGDVGAENGFVDGPRGTKIGGDLWVSTGPGNDVAIATAIGVTANVPTTMSDFAVAAENGESPIGLLHVGGNGRFDASNGDDAALVFGLDVRLGEGPPRAGAEYAAGPRSDVTFAGRLDIRTGRGNDIVGVGGARVYLFPDGGPYREVATETRVDEIARQRSGDTPASTSAAQISVDTGRHEDIAAVGNVAVALNELGSRLAPRIEQQDSAALRRGHGEWDSWFDPYAGTVYADRGLDVQLGLRSDMLFLSNLPDETTGVVNGGLGENLLYGNCDHLEWLVANNKFRVKNFEWQCVDVPCTEKR